MPVDFEKTHPESCRGARRRAEILLRLACTCVRNMIARPNIHDHTTRRTFSRPAECATGGEAQGLESGQLTKCFTSFRL